ncbi:MAG: hypothetical protein K6E95_00665 [Lachnospiraceae bacterium]|nr:hypothetical protein [Lachnospiraceae bacterium]
MEKIKKKSKERSAKGYLVAGIIAIVLAVSIWGLLIFVEDSILSKHDTQVYLAFNTSLGKGTQIKDLSVFTTLNINKDVVPENCVLDADSLLGKYVLSDVSERTLCTTDRFGDLPLKDEDSRTLSIRVEDISQAVNGRLRASDKIDLYLIPTSYKEETQTTEEDGNEEKAAVFTALSETYAGLVLDAVYDADGIVIPNDDTIRLATSFDITVNEKDADKIISMLSLGYRVWIDLVAA